MVWVVRVVGFVSSFVELRIKGDFFFSGGLGRGFWLW